MGAPRVLIIAPVPSHPPLQGNSARINAFGAELKRRGVKADFLYYGMEGLAREQAEVMIGFWNRFVFVRSVPLRQPRYARAWGIDDWCADPLVEAAQMLHATHQYDAVIVNYVWMSRVLAALSDTLKIIDTHDLFGDRHLIAESQSLEPRWFFTSAEEEGRGFRRADLVLAIQYREAETIRARFSGPVLTVGHPLEPRFLFEPAGRTPHFTFGYLGSGNPWNVRSVLAIDAGLAVTPVARWTLAGTITRRHLSLASSPYLMGIVDRVEDFYRAVDCVLNPMLGGTGLKIKTIEALAFGKPVIGTKDAFEGLRVAHPFHHLETIEEMIEAMRAYAANPALARELAAASRRLFITYMAEVERGYDTLVETIAAARRRASGASPPRRRVAG